MDKRILKHLALEYKWFPGSSSKIHSECNFCLDAKTRTPAGKSPCDYCHADASGVCKLIAEYIDLERVKDLPEKVLQEIRNRIEAI